MTASPALLVGILLGGIGCAGATQAGPATPSYRSNPTAKAGDCHFIMPDGTRLMSESEVDVPPRLLEPGPQIFPPQARLHGIPGRVRVTSVIGRNGFAIKPSFRVVEATNEIFVPATGEMIYGSRFSPGAHLGAPVATCVSQVVHFQIQ